MGKSVTAVGTTSAKDPRQDQNWCVSHITIIITLISSQFHLPSPPPLPAPFSQIHLLPFPHPSAKFTSSPSCTLQPNELPEPPLLCAHAFGQVTLHAGMPSFLSNFYLSFKTQLKGLLLREAFLDLESMAHSLVPFCCNLKLHG